MKSIFFKIFVTAIIFCSVQVTLTAQSNYTRTYVARQAEQTSLKNKPVSQVNVNTVYADGLSRPVQSVVKQGSDNQKDIILHYEYDDLGRQIKDYLPFAHASATTGNYIANALSLQQNEYGIYGYSETRFDNSPARRVLKQGAPGQDWQVSGSHTVEFQYLINDDAIDTIHKWFVSKSGTLHIDGNYVSGDLSMQVTIDEEGRQVKVFTDEKGRQVLKKVQGPGTQWLETYYTYDDFNNLRFILPPTFVKEINDNYSGSVDNSYDHDLVLNQTITQSETHAVSPDYSITLAPGFLFTAAVDKTFVAKILGGEVLAPVLAKYTYQYKYDERQRLIEKKLPGAAPIFYVYDEWNRLVLTQNGEQRASDQWTYMKYDALNRPAVTGTYIDNRSLSAIKTDLASYARYENRTSSGHGYSLNLTFPANPPDAEILTVSYYDNYDFVGSAYFASGSAFDFASNDISGQTLEKFAGVNGLPTGGKTRVVGQTDWLGSVSYYDGYLRLSQVVAENHLGGMDRMSMLYTFSGELAESKHTHYIDDNGSPGTSIYTFKDYEYDHVGRPQKVYQQIQEGSNPAGPKILLSSFNYDERGQLTEQNLHAKNPGETEFLQSLDFQYNIRGWLTKINNGGLDQGESGADADLFGLELLYNNTLSGVTTTQKYNGNISAQRWAVAHQPDDEKEKLYAYTYDVLDRLTDADYMVKAQSGLWRGGAFDVANITYDLNGNITGMDRWTKGSDGFKIQIDDLSYTYSGNQLAAVNDAITANNEGFIDLAETSDEYGYDQNGRLIRDDNKGITSITYNVLEQPEEVVFNDGRKTTYSYTAAGAKITEKAFENDVLQKTVDYIGGMIYTDGQLDIMQHDAGRVVVNRDGSGNVTGYEYQYFLTDHQGNVRATVSSETTQTEYVATMETENATLEDQHFGNINSVVSAAANHTPVGNEAIRLNNTSSTGPSFVLDVKPGDKVDMETWGHYMGGNGYNNQLTLSAMITSIAAAFGGLNGGTEAQQLVYDAINGGIGVLGLGGSNGSTVPAAYLNYLVFDKHMVYQKGGFASISSAANGSQEEISLNNVTIDKPGYIYVYVSNESNARDWVYFDDLTITVTESPLVQVEDYYPYGMSMSSSWQRAGRIDNKFLFNGGAEKEDHTGLYYTAFRRYDPALGRFHAIDPLSESVASLSPYQYGFNSPVLFNDPNGLMSRRWIPNAPDPRDPRGLNVGPTFGSGLGGGFGDGFNGPGSGNHWSDGTQYSDWTLHGGSPTYLLGLSMGLTDVGGTLYKINADGSRDAFGIRNGRKGFYKRTDSGDPGASSIEIINGEPVEVLAGITVSLEFVPLDQNGEEVSSSFNWGIFLGLIGTTISAGVEFTEYKVRTSFKSARDPISFNSLKPSKQEWRIVRVLGKNGAKFLKFAKFGGVTASLASVALSSYNIASGTATAIDYFDAGIGTASIGAAIFLASNPIGWVIGAGAAVYFAGRLAYDIYNEFEP